jgi:hypothetical protein
VGVGCLPRLVSSQQGGWAGCRVSGVQRVAFHGGDGDGHWTACTAFPSYLGSPGRPPTAVSIANRDGRRDARVPKKHEACVCLCRGLGCPKTLRKLKMRLWS